MSTNYLLGVDTGTTYTKVGIYDPSGKEVILKRSPTPAISVAYGGVEFNPDAVWKNLTKLIRSIPSEYRKRVKAVSISSFAETVYPLGLRDVPLDNGIAWFDRRTAPQNERVKSLFDPVSIRKFTGLFPAWIYSLNKILWFKENKPELYTKTKIWLDNAGYIIFKLSGEKLIDYSLACRTMMFDLWKRTWSDKILNKFEIDPAILPKPVSSGIKIGKIRKKAAKETGLDEGTLIVSGGHDHLCAALSVGAINAGIIQDSTGTSESILVGLKEAERIDSKLIEQNFILANHVIKDTFCVLQGVYCGGFLLDWFLSKILGDPTYRVLEKIECKKTAPLFIPYLRGSDFGLISGALIGLRDFHDRDSILCAILETMAFELKKMVDNLEKVMDITGWVLRSTGGGAKNETLLKYKTNLLGKNIEIPVNQEASCQGAAILAGIGSGVYKSAEEAVERTFKVSRVYSPQPSWMEYMQSKYQKYQKILENYGKIEKTLM